MTRLSDGMGNIKRQQRLAKPSVGSSDAETLFATDAREYAFMLVEDSMVPAQHLLACALKAMPAEDIRRMLAANELQPSMLGLADPSA